MNISLQQMDEILSDIVHSDKSYVIIEDLLSKYSMPRVLEILHKLDKDGFIVSKKMPSGEYNYNPTIEGRYFLDSGGYVMQYQNTIAQNTRLATMERSNKVNRDFLTVLTVLIAFGTLVAAWYYGIEICKYYHYR